jgi:large subunit ribosomal protein L24e
VRYNRELVRTTIKAMKRIAEIKKKRERVFWKNRCVRAN